MTRNPAHSANADDSWEQLEADLFGVEVGKEHTAAERVASEPELPPSEEPIQAVAKPIEEDDFGDFGDFGAGLVEPDRSAEPPPRRSSTSSRSRAKPQPAADLPPAKPFPLEPAPAFNLSDLDEGPTDEELDETDDEDSSEAGEAEAEGDDPYWDPLANWNWQEDDQSRKPASESGPDRGRSRGGRSDRPERGGPRGRGGRGDRRPSRADEPPPAEQRERSRLAEAATAESVADAPQVAGEVTAAEDVEQLRPAGKSRRQDRRRSRRHTTPAVTEHEEPVVEHEHAEPVAEKSWPPLDESEDIAEPPRSRTPRLEELDIDFEEETTEVEAESAEEGDDRGPRRRRGRRRRRRGERPVASHHESAADEDIKHLEDETDDFDDVESVEEPVGETEETESGRPTRSRRPRRRRRGARPERSERPAPAARAPQDFDEDDDIEEDEVLASDADDEFDEDQDREFVEEETAPRARRPSRSRRSASEAPFVRHIEDEDDDGEPEPAISYEDVPSWEEAISYLLNPSMVEGGSGGGGDRGDRPPRGERPQRPPRRGPRRD